MLYILWLAEIPELRIGLMFEMHRRDKGNERQLLYCIIQLGNCFSIINSLLVWCDKTIFKLVVSNKKHAKRSGNWIAPCVCIYGPAKLISICKWKNNINMIFQALSIYRKIAKLHNQAPKLTWWILFHFKFSNWSRVKGSILDQVWYLTFVCFFL